VITTCVLFQIQLKAFKAQINHHADELRLKDILAAGLARDNTIIATKHENALVSSVGYR